jgi:cytoskeletal protein CcmA (bactofilin family)
MLEVKRKSASPSHGCAHGDTASARAVTPTDSTAETQPAGKPILAEPVSRASSLSSRESKVFQTKSPAITGEAHFKGTLNVDGSLSGQLGSGSSVTVKQRSTTLFASEPELTGDISFKDMIRVNGHIAGTLHSSNGTVIVDMGANVEADLDVAVAVISGTVKGDIVARERVELGPTSQIYGNIWTRSIVIKHGAIFEGVCRMIGEAQAG